ncbi:MAG TPA: hypothetical protein VJ183_01595 [Chloroflexia bacterium]|nr:hypothetical protein [Chloroflexia bacterium]
MTLRTVQVGSLPYTYSPDDSMPVGRRLWGVIGGMVVDEITGRAPDSRPFISTKYRGLVARTTQDGGMVGLLGIPEKVFPNLRLQSYPVEFMVGAEGYITRSESRPVPANLTFPDDFTPVLLSDVELHRLPVSIRGRTVLLAGAGTTGLSGSSVQVTGYWPTTASTTGAASPANMLWLHPPLYFSRTAAVGILRRREITAIGGQDKTLLLDAPAGGTTLRLSDGVSVAAGGVLWVDADDAERMEYMTVGTVAGASTPDQPVTVTLTYPLAFTHRAGVKVSRGNVGPVLPPPAGFTKQFARDALPGDGVVFLNDVANVGVATVVEVTGSPNASEFHRFRLYEATSNANGYFSLPPVSRVAQLRIAATHPAQAAIPPRLLSLRYDLQENRIDFVFR